MLIVIQIVSVTYQSIKLQKVLVSDQDIAYKAGAQIMREYFHLYILINK